MTTFLVTVMETAKEVYKIWNPEVIIKKNDLKYQSYESFPMVVYIRISFGANKGAYFMQMTIGDVLADFFLIPVWEILN